MSDSRTGFTLHLNGYPYAGVINGSKENAIRLYVDWVNKPRTSANMEPYTVAEVEKELLVTEGDIPEGVEIIG